MNWFIEIWSRVRGSMVSLASRLSQWFLRAPSVWLLGVPSVGALAALVWGGTRFWDELAPFRLWVIGEGNLRETGSTTIRNLGLVLAGAIAIPLAWWRSRVAAKQADVAQQSLWNERYQTAAGMLGSSDLSVRLGGIYALEALIDEHPDLYYVQCMRVLCAFVRDPTDDSRVSHLSASGGLADPFEENRLRGSGSNLRADVQAVMDLMYKRGEKWIGLEQASGFVIDLRGADLSEGNLRSVNLSKADLRAAKLTGVYLGGADLSGAGLSHADLTDTSLYGADLSGVYLTEANVSGTRFCDRSFDGGFGSPVFGLTDYSLAQAYAAFENPPVLGGVVLNAGVGFPLEWNGRVLYLGEEWDGPCDCSGPAS